MSVRIQAFLIFCCGLLLFTMGLASQEIINFESRFYLFALEMWRHGPTFFPMTYHHPYPDYPATSTFLIYLFSSMLGEINKFTAVFPSAMASAMTLACTYLIGALHSRRWGFYAVLFLLLTAAFLQEARSISLDQYIVAITTICFYLIYSAKLLQKSNRIFWIFPLLILGFAFRGPLGLVIPTGVICVFYLLEQDFKQFFLIGIISTLLLCICSLVLLALAYHVGGHEFIQDVLRMELIGRMQGVKSPPIFYYFIDSFGAYALSFPLMILIVIGILRMGDGLEKKLLAKLVGWILVIMLGLSLPGDKKIRYILAISPALALICGYLLSTAPSTRYLILLKKSINGFCRIFPMLCIATILIVHQQRPVFEFYYVPSLLLLCLIQAMIFLTYRREWSAPLLTAAAFVMAVVLVVEPINLGLNKTRDFVVQVENLRQDRHADLVFFNEGKDGLVVKYLVNMSKEDKILFIKRANDLPDIKNSTVLIASKKHFEAIPAEITKFFEILLRGKIGHEEMIVFRKVPIA